jgi:hypothetical protein
MTINLITKDSNAMELMGIMVTSSLDYLGTFYHGDLDEYTVRSILVKELADAKELIFCKHESFKYWGGN